MPSDTGADFFGGCVPMSSSIAGGTSKTPAGSRRYEAPARLPIAASGQRKDAVTERLGGEVQGTGTTNRLALLVSGDFRGASLKYAGLNHQPGPV